MYQNGVKVTGYNKKCIHKRKQKNRHIKMYYYGTGELPYNTWEDFLCKYNPVCEKNHHRYWYYYNLSNVRTYAKNQTNRKIRRKYNVNINQIPVKYDYMDTYYDCVNLDIDYADMPIINKKALYKKEFDYMWTVY